MKTIHKIIMLSLLIMTMIACNTFTPKPTETPAPTETSAPTSTNTPEPSNTPTNTPIPPTETPAAAALHMPTGKPASDWEGIPVMPNALAGEGDSQGYSFTINASADEIQKFYEKELGKLGFTLLGSGQGATNAVILMFTKGTDFVSMSIIPQADGAMYVLLVK